MLSLLAVFCPPLAVLLTGTPFQVLTNIPLTLSLWVPGVAHALIVVDEYQSIKRSYRMAHETR